MTDAYVRRLRRKLGPHGGHAVTVRRISEAYRPPARRPAPERRAS